MNTEGQKIDIKHPNLFCYATSELSQDAFLCWLLAWADPKYAKLGSSLFQVAQNLIRIIYKNYDKVCPDVIESVKVARQVDHIDVLCIVNKQIALLIEDKAGTVEHGDQVARYMQLIQKKYKFTPEQIIPAYVQTGDQDFQDIRKKGYLIIRRCDLLQIFEAEYGRMAQKENDIFRDFVAYLRRKEDAANAYASTPVKQWDWACWVGFYQALQDKGVLGKWRYVANASGGFVGFWWHFRNAPGIQIHLQWEQCDNLCFKITVVAKENRRALREMWHGRILDECKSQGLSAKRPARFGSGKFMTVVILENARVADENGVLDFFATCTRMKRAEKVIDALTQG